MKAAILVKLRSYLIRRGLTPLDMCNSNCLIVHACRQVLKPVAAATSKVRALKGLSLKESVSQFSSTMTAQADLRVECAHLRRFYNNFASVSQSVTPPYPFPGCETAEVLIETFEPGESILVNLFPSIWSPA